MKLELEFYDGEKVPLAYSVDAKGRITTDNLPRAGRVVAVWLDGKEFSLNSIRVVDLMEGDICYVDFGRLDNWPPFLV